MRKSMAGLSTRIAAAGAVVADLTIAGCSESTAPTTMPRGITVGKDGRPDLRPNGSFGGHRTTSFTVTAAGGSFDVGMFTVNFPANSVCDPNTSSYGPGTWDSDCDTLGDDQSVTVTATYGFTGRDGPVIDFSPALRFNPNTSVTISTDAYAPVLTFFRNYWLSNPDALRFFGMYYTSDFGATGVTDAGRDASLITHVNLTTGIVWRRVKHFSGYN